MKQQFKVNKTYEEINEKIRKGEAVVVTAEEMIEIVEELGVVKAAEEVDVVTTGTFGAMCSSGAFLNVGHTKPRMKMEEIYLNGVPAYGGLAAVDLYIGASVGVETEDRWATLVMINKRWPYQTGKNIARAINTGKIDMVSFDH
jgi:uncharacterized protein (DUF39 family)